MRPENSDYQSAKTVLALPFLLVTLCILLPIAYHIVSTLSLVPTAIKFGTSPSTSAMTQQVESELETLVGSPRTDVHEMLQGYGNVSIAAEYSLSSCVGGGNKSSEWVKVRLGVLPIPSMRDWELTYDCKGHLESYEYVDS